MITTPDEEGYSLDPFCPPYLDLRSHDIIDGHVTLSAHAPDGQEFFLRLPIEKVRELAKETEGYELE